MLCDLNHNNKRKLPADPPLEFIPKSLRSLVEHNGVVDKQAWECALLFSVRDQIKVGNIAVKSSKRFGRLDQFFVSYTQWKSLIADFFKRAQLPEDPDRVPEYLNHRLNKAFDAFLAVVSF